MKVFLQNYGGKSNMHRKAELDKCENMVFYSINVNQKATVGSGIPIKLSRTLMSDNMRFWGIHQHLHSLIQARHFFLSRLLLE
jgi:hypothetical protein